MSDGLTFFFDGEARQARPGLSVAAALTDAGDRVFRHTAKGSPRGLFCGMGVCQDCLVTVDGVPNQRACMTMVEDGARVQRQIPRPELALPDGFDKQAAEPSPAGAATAVQELTPDVLIVGAGAGGLNAATAASRAGAAVLVLDERKVAGGQYFKQAATDVSVLDTQQASGARLLADARASGARLMSGVEIWGAFAGPLLYATAADGAPLILRPKQLIIATGAYERPRMVPGWTLPGVMTTGAAQTLWRSYRSLPGKRIAVCGSGPLNLQVALELAKGGAEICMLAESAASPYTRPVLALGLFLAGPRLALSGLKILLGLARRQIPVHYQSVLVVVEQLAEGQGLRATFRGPKGEFTRELDALCMNDGFEPQNEILRLLGAELQYDEKFGHFRCTRDDSFQTSISNVYAIGDCCGLGGAPAAESEGKIAGASAALACGVATSSADDAVSGARRALRKAQGFQKRLWKLHDPGAGSLEDVSDDTIVCRCEEISLGQFRAGLAGDTAHIGALKLATRAGMGCCQGRYCGPVAARLVAQSSGQTLSDYSYFAPRVPIKPVSIAALLATQEALDDQA
ncbi:2Fe-2S iron-sulfur cluster-binding protein [Congregibacter sp.]|nr:2Fe-2S iron-sulfur cluster-binding protein [Congregibacter sp.]MDA8962077.1 2Fe-2S iron-sulfur cluster-binding protein [Congregibacter sp.]